MSERDPVIRGLIAELGLAAPAPRPLPGLDVPPADRMQVAHTWSRALVAAMVVLTFFGGVAVGYLVWGALIDRPVASDEPAPGPPSTVAPNNTLGSEGAAVTYPVAECPEGSTPNEPGPVEQARPPTSDPLWTAFDRQSGRLVLLAQRRTWTGITWTFDVCTNTWEEMRPANDPSWPTGILVYHPGVDQTFLIDSDGILAYDLEANTWMEQGDPPPGFFPNVGVFDEASGLVVVLNGVGEAWTYDAAFDVWTERSGPPWTENSNPAWPDSRERARSLQVVFDPLLSRIVVWREVYQEVYETWTYDVAGDAWERLDMATEGVHTGYGAMGGLFAHHLGSGLSVMYANGEYALFDSSAGSWEYRDEFDQVRDTPLDRLNQTLVYDPINDRILMVAGKARLGFEEIWTDVDDVWAYDPADDEWSVLLERSGKGAG